MDTVQVCKKLMQSIAFVAACAFFVWVLLAHSANAMRDTYPALGCELIAQDWQDEHSGNLIFVDRIGEDGRMMGHWMNYYYNKTNMTYYDYEVNESFSTKEQVVQFFMDRWNNDTVNVYNYNTEQNEIPFHIIHDIWRN